MVKENLEKQYYIPMEIGTKSDVEFAMANGYDIDDFVWRRIGNRNKKVILVPCSKEQYLEYMRPIWKDMKRKERQKEYFEAYGIQSVSIDYISEMYELDIVDPISLDDYREREALLNQLRELLDKLEGLDKQIMDMHLDGHSETAIGKAIDMSQKGVNKRKQKVIKNLKLHFSE